MEALGGSSMKFGSGASTAGGADANGTAWTGEAGAGGEGNVGGGAGVDGGVDVGSGDGAGGEEGATLLLLMMRPSSVASSSSSSSSSTTWGAFLLGFLRTSFLRWLAGWTSGGVGPFGGDRPCAAAISTTEFGTVWEPDANPWVRASALSSASLPLPNILSA